MTEQAGSRPFTAFAFNQYLNEKKLMGSRCTQCESVFIPPRAFCPHCQADKIEWFEFSGKGKLAAFTSIGIGPSFMNALGYGRDNPYATGIVELEEGGKISARILGVDAKDPASIKIGLPMSVDFIETGEGETRKVYLGFKAI